MKVSPLVLFIFCGCTQLLLSSCNNNEKEAAALAEIAATFTEASKDLDQSAKIAARELSGKLEDPGLKDMALRSIPTMAAINDLSAGVAQKLDSLASRLSPQNHAAIVAEAARSYGLHISSVVAKDEQLRHNFPQWLSEEQQPGNYNSFLLAKVYLQKLRYETSKTNELASRFFNYRVAYGCILNFDKTGILIGQSSNILEPGQTLEISAGVGSYSNAAQPSFMINKKTANNNSEPYATSKIKVPQQPGNYSVPVEINYTNQEGEKVRHEHVVRYRVVKAVEE